MKKLGIVAVITFGLFFTRSYAQLEPQREFIFPFFAYGGAANSRLWVTSFAISNAGQEALLITAQAFDPEGSDLQVRLSDQRPIPPFASRFLEISFPRGLDQLTVGWIKIQLSAPGFIQGTLEVSSFSSGATPPPPDEVVFANVPLVPGVGFKRATISVRRGFQGRMTGIAITFPQSVAGSAPARGTAVLKDTDSKEVARKELTIPARGQKVFLVDELFPEFASPEFTRGAMELIFDAAPSQLYAKAVFIQPAGAAPLQLIDQMIGKIN